MRPGGELKIGPSPSPRTSERANSLLLPMKTITTAQFREEKQDSRASWGVVEGEQSPPFFKVSGAV